MICKSRPRNTNTSVIFMKSIFHVNKIEKIIMKFIDIGVNLTNPMFQGIYRGTKKHQPDLEVVLKRSWEAGMEKMIVTVGELSDVEEVAKIVEKDDRLVMTVGCHPMNCGQFVADPEKYFMDLKASIEKYRNKVVAAGEMGLDYYLEEYCERECQKKYFEKQIELMEIFDLPVFLHCRDSYKDFMAILERNMEKISHGGVIHSFDGSLEEANRLIDMGFYLGLTGCSMKTEEQLKVVKAIPIERIMIETDAPWCSIRSSYAAAKYVKTNFSTAKKKEKWSPDLLIDGRCEPVQILQVLEAVAGIKNEDENKLAEIFYQNTIDVFFSKKS